MPSASAEAEPVKSTGSGALPMVGSALAVAVGTTFGGPTSIETVAAVATPSSSVTVSVAV